MDNLQFIFSLIQDYEKTTGSLVPILDKSSLLMLPEQLATSAAPVPLFSVPIIVTMSPVLTP